MNLTTENKTATLLFNPFFFIAGAKALVVGLIVIGLAGLIGAVSNTHFDGVLDTHTGAHVPLWIFLIEGVIDWFCLALVLAILALIISRKSFRIIDIFGTQALARWPTILLGLLMLPDAIRRFAAQLMQLITNPKGQVKIDPTDAAIFAIVMIASLPVLCWLVYLMYKSFSVSCNVKGGKAIGIFIAGLLGAEVLSKFCIGMVLQQALTTPIAVAQLPDSVPAVQTASTNSPADQITNAAGQFVDLLATGQFNQAVARFDAKMKQVFPEPSLRSSWRDLEKKVGPFKSKGNIRIKTLAGYRVALVPCQFEKAALDLKIVFDPKGEVAGLFYVPTGSE